MSRPSHVIRLVVFANIASGWLLFPEVLQAADKDFKPGDSVEVERGRDTLTGTVVEVDGENGWVTIRFEPDELRLPKSMPAHMRERASTRKYPGDKVRLIESAKPENPRAGKEIPAKQPKVGESRTWSDRSGKFRVTAKFVRSNENVVVLVRDDGKQIEVPLEKLSEADAKYIQDLKNQKEREEDPFWEPPPVNQVTSSEANWKDVKVVRPRKFSGWDFSPPAIDSSAMLKLSNLPNVEVPLKDIPQSEQFFEDVVGVYIADNGSRAIVCRTKGNPGGANKQFVELIDLTTQSSLGMASLPAETKLLDAYPAESLIMYCPDQSRGGENSELTIASLESGEIKRLTQWEPYIHEEFEPARSVLDAKFLDANRILTANEFCEGLTIWDVGNAKALMTVPIAQTVNLKYSLSNDRKMLSVVMSKAIAIIDLDKGSHVATVPTDDWDWGADRVELRGDHRRLAAISDDGVAVWDLTTGKKMPDFSQSISESPRSIRWAGEYLVLNSRYLFDVDRRILLWEYLESPLSEWGTTFRDGRLWMVSRDKQRNFTPFFSLPFPHSEALAKAKALPPLEKLFAIQPGAEVTIQVDIDPAIASPDEVKASIASGLEDAGFQVVEDSKLVVSAICKAQEQQTIRINMGESFRPRPEDIVERTIVPHASYLEMKLDGEVLWKRGHISRPGMMIYINHDESLDQALERLTKPNIEIIMEAKYTSQVTRPGKASPNGAYGVSRFEGGQFVEATSTGETEVFE